ncbi:hypothetical protein G6F46_012221 [Rhizopus delemar]|uniref:Reverse transcriptase domain-containing protein n=3 Tax=Rhizopus TaxID=4842 RepID=I1CB17_RHIO9|nr:hypothetical protein RO3G_10357 [Rhizopus delemar RA 99-880]KAG1165189.1 hypothetical protein G6F36_013450 [Rhizopus arrhizus]KAG1455067.1 hypothetical protein G6F55_007279 [Rhizopus delemar]KAG1488443.1 hypothetical protein G6F54_012076 [Rhizopus delemar]KAG1509129.1 hypothetical protein G6F53_007677 [Rhizopus delemar]|eukprot:EIE85647.1 hypothetical protein RO3G_10357 [Rhizopus delemar RA 99-880]
MSWPKSLFYDEVIQDNPFFGFTFTPLTTDLFPPPVLKVLAYADDICEDIFHAQHHLDLYAQVSNAKVDLSKIEAIFLNFLGSPSWQQLLLYNKYPNGISTPNHSYLVILNFLSFNVDMWKIIFYKM